MRKRVGFIEYYFHRHPEQLFVLKSVCLISLLNILENIFFLWWLAILVFAPLFVWCLLQVISIHQDKSIVQVLIENLTLIPVPYLDEDNNYSEIPWVTYSLILLNVFVYYLVIPSLSESTFENLIFAPAAVTFLNVLISQVSNLFLHGDSWHLWGNMAFLWAIGTVLERRVGHGWLFGLYIASGVAGSLLFLVIGYSNYGYLPSLLGASGAVSGLMGVYAVRCYFKTMVFPFPVLGLFSFLFPIGLKVRMNALVVVGLFFWADLSAGVEQLYGSVEGNTAYWCHVGGMLAGLLLAYRIDLGGDAIQEKRLDVARSAFSGKDWIGADVGEMSIREYLQEDEGNSEAVLLLARKVSKYSNTEEGKELYQNAIILLLQSDINNALTVYREYFNKYLEPLRSDLQFRMAVLAEREGDDNFATRALEALLNESNLDVQLKGKCLFHCARLCRKMGLSDAAQMYEEKEQALVER